MSTFDLTRETLITLPQAAKLIPPSRGRKTCTSTLWRWCVAGKGGVRLEHVRTPHGVYLTTHAAVVRFLAAMAGPQQPAPAPAPQIDWKQHEEAMQRLREMGVKC